jgi:hypothetical protein
MQNLSSIYEDDISDSSLNSVPAAGMKLLRESTTDTRRQPATQSLLDNLSSF